MLVKERVSNNAGSQVKVALWIYALLVVAVTELSWSIYTRGGDFLTRPLFGKDDQFRDLTNYAIKVAHLSGGAAALGSGKPIFNYPPPAAFAYKALIYTFPGYAVQTYVGFLILCILGFAFVALRASRAANGVGPSAAAAILITAVFGYPLWFTADRGNIEGVAWALAAAGLCFLLRGRYRTGAVLIGLAASVKPFSILFLLLLVRRRRYGAAAIGVASTGLAVLMALTVLGPNPWEAYQALKPGVALYMGQYVTNLTPIDEARFDHSLLDGMKSAALAVEMGGIHPQKSVIENPKLRAEPGGWHGVRPLVRVYPLIVVAGFGLLLAVFYKMPMLNQVTALGVAITLFPLSAGDYTLLHLYVPFGALVIFMTREVAVGTAVLPYRSMLAFAVIYALLFSPLTFLMIYAADAKMLLLIALLVVAARTPMHSAYFDDGAEARTRGDGVGVSSEIRNSTSLA